MSILRLTVGDGSQEVTQKAHWRSYAPPVACVMGDMNLVRPLGLANITCAVAATSVGNMSAYSRFARNDLCWTNLAETPESHIDALLRFAASQPEPPVLFYESDWQLLMVSRFREQLSGSFRFVIPDAELVENLADKNRFQELSQKLGLPVPVARRIIPTMNSDLPFEDMRFPLLLKPIARNTRSARRKPWDRIGGSAKALLLEDLQQARELWPRLVEVGMELLVQELIAGPESNIESYHVYIDREDRIVAEFTGKKLRTYPVEFGYTTALEITNAPDVMEQGREVVRKLRLQGVAKLDYKRSQNNELFLLEINPRFNLWHYPGAVAGVNIPALVYADMAGLPRPPVRVAQAGVRWCDVGQDYQAARASGVPLLSWLSWALRCEAEPNLNWDDPAPLLHSVAHRLGGLMQRRITRGKAL